MLRGASFCVLGERSVHSADHVRLCANSHLVVVLGEQEYQSI